MPVVICPTGVVCQVDPTRDAYSRGYMIKVMETFNRCIDADKR